VSNPILWFVPFFVVQELFRLLNPYLVILLNDIITHVQVHDWVIDMGERLIHVFLNLPRQEHQLA